MIPAKSGSPRPHLGQCHDLISTISLGRKYKKILKLLADLCIWSWLHLPGDLRHGKETANNSWEHLQGPRLVKALVGSSARVCREAFCRVSPAYIAPQRIFAMTPRRQDAAWGASQRRARQ